MIWKPKEKELTPEEAIHLAKEELRPLWFNSEPRIAGIRTEGKSVLLPLDSEFSKNPWVIIVIDPADFSGERALIYAAEWYQRYRVLQLGVLVILQARYVFSKSSESIREFIDRRQPQFPVALDSEGILSEAFCVSKLPKFLLLQGNRIVSECEGGAGLDDLENQIQMILRMNDPGLPLLPIFKMTNSGANDFRNRELGYGAPNYAPGSELKSEPNTEPNTELDKQGSRVFFSSPGFERIQGFEASSEDPTRKANFQSDQIKNSKFNEIYLFGEWIQEEERIITHDPKAVLSFTEPGSNVALVAECLSRSQSFSTLWVEVDGAPVYEEISGEDLDLTDAGGSEVRIMKPRLYFILRGMTGATKEITLRFPNAGQAPVALYGIRSSS